MTERILGMEPEKGRWAIIISGVLMNLCLGSIYAYSVIQVQLRRHFEELGQRVSATEMQLPFIVFLILFALMMPLAGKYIEKYGPRKVAYIGAFLVSLGWFSASFANSPLQVTFLYGIFGGIGVGIAYNCPLVTAARWFPERRGLAIGIVLFGFGFSAAIIAPIVDFLSANFGVVNTLRILGISFFLLLIFFSSFLRVPKAEWKPKGFKQEDKKRCALIELKREEVVRTKTFYGLWTAFAIGTLAGLMAIGISKPVGLEVAGNAGIAEFEVSALLTALTVPFAFLNGIGRPIFGALADRIGPMKTAVLSFSLIFFASLLAFLNPASLEAYILAFALLWLNLGGWLAIAPTATAYFFGMKDYARNYGVVYTAYGFGALIGNLLAGISKDMLGSYLQIFPLVSTLALFGIIVALATFKHPKIQ